jgi:uncharacterized membrane protein
MRPRISSEKSAPAADGKNFAPLHLLATFLLAAAFVLVLVKIFVPMNSGWPEAILILLATFSTLVALARQLPLQNVLLAAFGIALIGGGASAIGARTGIPFGPFMFGSENGPQFSNLLPWAMPLVWVIVVLNSRGVARLILRPWRKTRRYGFWIIGMTAVLTMLFVLALEPFASRIRHYWLWSPTKLPLTWQGAPLADFLGWGFVTALMLVFVTPALINKQLSKRRGRDFHPLALWLGAILFFAVASGQHGLWIAVTMDSAICIVTTVFAIRGARW